MPLLHSSVFVCVYLFSLFLLIVCCLFLMSCIMQFLSYIPSPYCFCVVVLLLLSWLIPQVGQWAGSPTDLSLEIERWIDSVSSTPSSLHVCSFTFNQQPSQTYCYIDFTAATAVSFCSDCRFFNTYFMSGMVPPKFTQPWVSHQCGVNIYIVIMMLQLVLSFLLLCINDKTM